MVIVEDGVDYFVLLVDWFGEILVYFVLINDYVDWDFVMVFVVWVDYVCFIYILIVILIFFCFFEVGWYDELFILMEVKKSCFWFDEKFVVEVFICQGWEDEVLVCVVVLMEDDR